MLKKENIKIRAIKEAEYIIKNNATLRDAGMEFGVSKSTIHRDMTVILKNINENLYKQVKQIFSRHKRVYKKKKACNKIWNGVRIYGTRKGKMLKFEWFMQLNKPIADYVRKVSVNRFEVNIDIGKKYAGLNSDQLQEIYEKKVSEFLSAGKI